MIDPTPETTPTRDEAVPAVTDEMLQAARDTLPGGFPDICDADLEDIWEAMHRTMLASAPAPASGGVDAVAEACAQAAEGPEYWPHPKQPGDVLTYRGTKDGNWLAVKPPFKLDPYSQGRADAAAAVRALSPTPVSEAGGEPVGWTGPGSLDALKKGEHGTLYPKPPTPLATPLYLAKPASSPAGVREASLSRSDVCRLWQHVAIERPSMTVEGFTNLLLMEIDDRAEALSQSTSAGRVGG